MKNGYGKKKVWGHQKGTQRYISDVTKLFLLLTFAFLKDKKTPKPSQSNK